MLDGIKIIEVEGLGPGPFASMFLADLGADVIVVHREKPSPLLGGAGATILDRGKRSVVLDLKAPDDAEQFRNLAASADGLIEGFRPGVMERLGMGPDVLMGLNPALVYGRMTGWGQSGPLSEQAGHDLNYIGRSGALWYASEAGQPPLTPPTMVGDIGGGALYLVIGMLSGIMAARQSGKGSVVDAAIFDGSAHMMNLLMAMRPTGSFTGPRGQSVLDGPHWCRTYQCADGGFVTVQAVEPKFYAEFLARLGLADDADFQKQYETSSWEPLSDRLAEIFAQQDRAHWEALFEGSDACIAPVLSPEEAVASDLSKARNVWHDTGSGLQAAPAPKFSGQEDWTPPALPRRGQHQAEIQAAARQGLWPAKTA